MSLLEKAWLAGKLGVCSNHILDHLEEWGKLLQHSSLARMKPENANEKKDGDAPCNRHPAAAQRRRKA
ncbi:hypothetical protein [Novosphingobium naphthalenivorans]|uniref:hypothetical protein n=1 Tax=Novosphingobium naphthalenivorans TaxID=273168 RepID=UPI000A879C56|nr:hypothetical protein [Novosphingobium naphthalenivorans]